SLVTLSDGTTIVIDLNVTEASSDESDSTRYDVHNHLLREAKRDPQRRPYHDAVILSHADQDHNRGFDKVFYTGDPTKYSEKDKTNSRIIANELWFAPRIFSPHEAKLCEDAKVFKREAQRRVDLYRAGAAERALPGNRIRIIGYSDNPELKGLEDV